MVRAKVTSKGTNSNETSETDLGMGKSNMLDPGFISYGKVWHRNETRAVLVRHKASSQCNRLPRPACDWLGHRYRRAFVERGTVAERLTI